MIARLFTTNIKARHAFSTRYVEANQIKFYSDMTVRVDRSIVEMYICEADVHRIMGLELSEILFSEPLSDFSPEFINTIKSRIRK